MLINKIRIFTLAVLSFVLSACITLPGHRHVTDEEGFYLHVEAPSKEQKELIRFNAKQTALTYLPANTWIELIVQDSKGKHYLKISNYKGSIVYKYKLDGRRTNFDESGKEWFATQIPKVVRKTGLKYG